jgi:hypothetical protein
VDVPGHIQGTRKLVHERLDAAPAALTDGPRRAVEIASAVHGEPLTEANASWFLQETLAYLRHLEQAGQVIREQDDDTVRWRAG